MNFSASYQQGDNLPEIKLTHDRDMSTFIANVRATAYLNSNVVSKALAADTEIKVRENLANILADELPAAGVPAIISSTGEWVLITAVDGITLTVTRAQNDPGGNPTIAKDIPVGAPINLIPLDSVPLTTELDPLDTTNQSVIHTLSSEQTRIIPATYSMDIYYSSGSGASVVGFTSKGSLTITSDANQFGAP